MSTVRMVLALASSRRLRLDQMDFETAYLNADLGDKVYVEPPPELNLPADKVCLLIKALYGLKQSGKRQLRRTC